MSTQSPKYSCNKCDAEDDEHMVQCDECDMWFHYGCVEVGDEIANISWNCDNCNHIHVSSSASASTLTPEVADQLAETSTEQEADLLQQLADLKRQLAMLNMQLHERGTVYQHHETPTEIATFSKRCANNKAQQHSVDNEAQPGSADVETQQNNAIIETQRSSASIDKQQRSDASIDKQQRSDASIDKQQRSGASIGKQQRTLNENLQYDSITQQRRDVGAQSSATKQHQYSVNNDLQQRILQQSAAQQNTAVNMCSALCGGRQHYASTSIMQHRQHPYGSVDTVQTVTQRQPNNTYFQQCDGIMERNIMVRHPPVYNSHMDNSQRPVYSGFEQYATTAYPLHTLSGQDQPRAVGHTHRMCANASLPNTNGASLPHIGMLRQTDGDNTFLRGNPNNNCHNMQQQQSAFDTSQYNTSPTTTQIAARQVLPKDLPKFYGDPEEWPLFISSFETSSAIAGYTDAENLVRLQACLKGRAREVVRSKLLLPSMVSEVISTLRMCFGRPEFILENLIEKARKMPPIKEKLEALIDLALCVRNIYATIESCHMQEYMNNPMLVKELVDKLPNHYKLNWATHTKTRGVPIFKIFSDWLYSLAEAASEVVAAPSAKRSGHLNLHEEVNSKPAETSGCVHCKDSNHRIAQCKQFKGESYEGKWKIVTQNNLCKQCLNCHRRQCFSKRICGINNCKAKHHPLLHKMESAPANNSSQIVNSHAQESDNSFFRIIPVRIYGKTTFINTFAFLDEGSSVTLIDNRLFKQLNLDGEQESLCLRWTGNQTRTENASIKTTLEISKEIGGNKYSLRGVRTVENLGLPSQSVDMNVLVARYKHLKGLPISSYVDARPTILIGSDNWNVAIPLKVKEGSWHEPIATKTRLGWALQGCTTTQRHHINVHMCDCESGYRELNELVKNQFQLENPAKATLMSKEDARAIAILDNTCKKVGNRYETALLWRNDTTTLPDSYHMAVKRLNCLEKKTLKDGELKIKIQKQLDNLVTKGYAEELASEQINNNKGPVWYLPTFIVLNVNKPGKVRLVWDAAAKADGKSLNDFLLCGPDLLNSLFHVLLGFRAGRIGICADIAEMFHQIRVRDDDAHAQRFLWWNSDKNDKKPVVYVMRALSFGLNCAPCIAQYVRNKNAESFKAKFPRAAQAIQEFHYMDDFIDSADDEKQILQLAQEVRMIHMSAGFHIRNWVSNSKLVADMLNDNNANDQRSPSLTIKSRDIPMQLGSSEKVLGVFWDPNKDIFKYEFKFSRLKRQLLTEDIIPTKRELLQIVMSMFDPFGFISCHVIALKILLQEIWRAGLEWDQELPEQMLQKWKQWKATIPIIREVEVPRCLSTRLNEADNIQLHIFVDAGEYAYAAAAYIRVKAGINVDIRLIAGKSKVAPLKPVSIPRMELQAALLGVRLAAQILSCTKLNIHSKIFWTDSATVLKWLSMDPRTFKQFVMFRVAEILENSSLAEWRWVPSKQNPADLGTKIGHQINNAMWITGPKFLNEHEDNWPSCTQTQSDNITATKTELKTTKTAMFHVSHNISFAIKIEKFSSWNILYKTLATIFIFYAKLKAKLRAESLPNELRFELTNKAKLMLILKTQHDAFADELRQITNMQQLKSSSKLVMLNVYVDEQGVIRSRSRANALTDYDVIVLPYDHHITFLIVRSMHLKYHHLYQETAINEIKGQYYIQRLRVLYKKVRKNCQVCKILAALPRAPQMAQLPKARLGAFERPFTYVGVDYFGPLMVVVGRRSEKRWGVIFTCLTMRAVHIEVAHSLDTSSCVLCIRNFICRRGMPREIYSDNGTNFKATSKLLKEEGENLDFNKIEKKFDEIKWIFNPPAAPHMGGAWERLIRSIKTVLKNIQPDYKFNDETLRSSLAEVEYIINARPLTFVSLDCNDDEAITPNHLLLGSSGGYKPFAETNDLRQRYMRSCVYADRFWRRWVKEYCPIIARRGKWFNKQAPLKVGELVIIVDENLPRNTWPKGIIVETFVAKDGQVRRAKVRTAKGIFERPASKLAVLDVGIEQGKQS